MWGYYTNFGYMGNVNGHMRLFATAEEYREWYEENVYDREYL